MNCRGDKRKNVKIKKRFVAVSVTTPWAVSTLFPSAVSKYQQSQWDCILLDGRVSESLIIFVKCCLQHILNYVGLLVNSANKLYFFVCVNNVVCVCCSDVEAHLHIERESEIRSQGVTWDAGYICTLMIGWLRTDGETKCEQPLSSLAKNSKLQ